MTADQPWGAQSRFAQEGFAWYGRRVQLPTGWGRTRASAIAAQPAESIAEAAQSFGQREDITVLTLSRLHKETFPQGRKVAAATA